ncbi:cilia- and flagella-associated protein 74 isoform X3 [Gouania willdenowi]|uniref:cilia- and flagella-associated protein 74 isoform X3 n=1 Tax=Gouania willdenowi TaxID=441366 RepID=UPI00105527C0|nr:cilia- and flagella-associated protein 74 isoform X3 [Gouania willdenowi]
METGDRESSSEAESDRGTLMGLHSSTDEESDDFDPHLENSKDDEPPYSSDLKWLEELYEEDDDDDDDDSDSDLAVANVDPTKRSVAGTARMFKLRRNLDQLDSFHQQKEHDTLQAREQLKLCHQNIESLLEQRSNLEKEIEQQKTAENSVAMFRLRAQHKQLCVKLQSEEELEGRVSVELRQLELELNQMEVEVGQLSSFRQELVEEEHLYQDVRSQKAAKRMRQERKFHQNLHQKNEQHRNQKAAMLKEDELERQRKLEEAEANRKTAAKYLKQTLKRVRQQENEKEQLNRELVEKRIQAVKSLKSNIAVTKESLRVQQTRTKANILRKEQQQTQLRESLHAQGVNSIKHMHRQKQQEEIERKQKEFEKSQKSKRGEIMKKILEEEKQVKKRTKNEAIIPKPSNFEKLSTLRKMQEKLASYLDHTQTPTTGEKATIQFRDLADCSSSSSTSSDVENLEEGEDTRQEGADHPIPAESLAKPEFSGLWDQDVKQEIANEKTPLMQVEANLDKPPLTSGKIVTVSSKKMIGNDTGRPLFISKPEIVTFKDFELGKTYQKKIVLTNISYNVNHCKFLRVSPHLKDWISINFVPPGSLSSGMSCDLQVIFQPTMNKDVEGEILFSSSAQTVFSVPVRCTMKKCMPVVDSQLVDFGSHIVGQTISRTIILTNEGALATNFSLDTPTSPMSPGTSFVQTQNSANTRQVTSSQIESNKGSSPTDGDQIQHQRSPNVSEASQQELSMLDPTAADSETITEACVSSDVVTHIDQTTSDCDITLGQVKEGELGPYESIKLQILFIPTIPGKTELDFVIKFSDKSCKPIPMQAKGEAVRMPVCVVQPCIDLKICMMDRLYQDTISLQNSASTALKVNFDVRPEMKKHMEILPKTGFIQAQSAFHAQLKFMPRHSLAKDAGEFFDSVTGVLEVPMTIQVIGQVQPTCFTVHAVVTSSDLQFEPSEVDFRSCSIYDSVKSSVRIHNLSLLPQEFGFLVLPEFIEVQPNDGFGTLLPQETLEIFLIFSAKKAKEYNFQLSCKTEINRDFVLCCRGVGVRPPLQLSHSVVQFGATAVGDHSTAIIQLINDHTWSTQSKHAGTAVTTDDVVPAVGPRMFCFVVPEDSGISVIPLAARILPGERCRVQVTFTPRLLEQEIKDEALRLFQQGQSFLKKELDRKGMATQSKEEMVPGSGKVKKTSLNSESNKKSDDLKSGSSTRSREPVPVQPGSEQYDQAKASLLLSFTQRYREYVVPCFVSDGDPPEDDLQAQPAWSPINTLYLTLQCPAVQPPLLVISNNGHNVIDFHQVVVGGRGIQRCTIQNISNESIDLWSSLLDVCGPFSLLNALRNIRPGEKHTLVFAFCPALAEKHQDTIEIHCQRMSLALTLCGEGVALAVTCSHSEGLLDFGHVLAQESTSQVIKLQNTSMVAVAFRTLLDSLSPSQQQGAADWLETYTDLKVQPTGGACDHSGDSVFSVVPAEGSISPGQNQDITVTFHPRHPSINYFDKLTVELMSKSPLCVINLRGGASSHNMYVEGGDPLTVPFKSLLSSLSPYTPQLSESKVMVGSSMSVLVTLRATHTSDSIIPASRELQVGCVASQQTSKKNGEFHWDNVADLQQQGFSVEPSQGTIEGGHTCTITIRWTPQQGYKPHDVVQTDVSLTLKGNETNVYSVTLMAWSA